MDTVRLFFYILFYGSLSALVLMWLIDCDDPPPVPDRHPCAQRPALAVKARRIAVLEASLPSPAAVRGGSLLSRSTVLVDSSTQTLPGPLASSRRLAAREARPFRSSSFPPFRARPPQTPHVTNHKQLVSSKVGTPQVSEDKNAKMRQIANDATEAALRPFLARIEYLESENAALKERVAATDESNRKHGEEIGWLACAVKHVMSSLKKILRDEHPTDSDADTDSDFEYDSEPADEPEPAGQENVSGKRVRFVRRRTVFKIGKWIDPFEDVHQERTGEEVQQEIDEEEFLENECF